MSRLEKLQVRLQSRPVDFAWSELKTLMEGFGYELKTTGGSGRKFVRSDAVFMIHEPHPQKILKPYQIRALIEFLKKKGDIE